ESCPINSDASPIASLNFSLSFLTSGCSAASVGFGPSSFFLTGGFGAPGSSESFTAATRAFACSTIDAFSASAPASVPAGGIADGGGVPDASESETPGDVGSSEPGCFVSSDIYAGSSSTVYTSNLGWLISQTDAGDNRLVNTAVTASKRRKRKRIIAKRSAYYL